MTRRPPGSKLTDTLVPATTLFLSRDDVEHAALLQARRGVFILEDHRHVDMDGGMFRNAQEVGVQRTVGHGVESHILGEGADLLSAHFDEDDRIEEMAGAEQLVRSEESRVGKE